MYQEYKLPNQVEQLRQYFRKWLSPETRREIILPVPVSEAKYRIQIAFADTIKVSNGFFSPEYKYTGQIIDTKIDVKLSINGRNTLNYSMQGIIFSHPKGSRLSMVVKDGNLWTLLWIIIFSVIFITLIPGGKNYNFFLVCFLLLNIPLMLVRRSLAADNISELIGNIVNNNL